MEIKEDQSENNQQAPLKKIIVTSEKDTLKELFIIKNYTDDSVEGNVEKILKYYKKQCDIVNDAKEKMTSIIRMIEKIDSKKDLSRDLFSGKGTRNFDLKEDGTAKLVKRNITSVSFKEDKGLTKALLLEKLADDVENGRCDDSLADAYETVLKLKETYIKNEMLKKKHTDPEFVDVLKKTFKLSTKTTMNVTIIE